MALTKMGQKTKTLFLNEEAHKLNLEFEVAEGSTVKKGSAVVLETDGTVRPIAGTAGADKSAIIGYSLHDGAEGELITVTQRAFMVIFAEAAAAQVAGPVMQIVTAASDPLYVRYAVGAAATANGFALDEAAAAGEIIRVALF